jgi:hypothetical protein
MITREVIDEIYKKYKKPPKNADSLDMALLFENTKDAHDVYYNFDDEELIIPTIDALSPFHRIRVNHIHAIVPFEEWVAIVLHSSIIFLNKSNTQVSIHVKSEKPTLAERIKEKLRV